jgi:arylsulfatase A-like enzyme
MAEYQAFDKFFKDLGDGYLGQLNHNVAAMPDILANGGYTTIMSGKCVCGVALLVGRGREGAQPGIVADTPVSAFAFGIIPKG